MANNARPSGTLFFFLILGCAFSHILSAQAQDDIIPPEAVDLSLAPATINDSPSSQPVTFTLRITDNSSGFQSASWRLVSFSAQQYYDIPITAASRISGDGLDGIYEVVFDLPPHSEAGKWHVADLKVSDAEGNTRVYDDMPIYSSPAIFAAESGVSRVFARDFNFDSITDIGVVSAASVTVYPGSGNGTFGLGIPSASGSTLQGSFIGDFNGDGLPDIAFKELDDVVGAISPVGVLFGNANGTFQPYRTVGSMPYEVGPAVGDFDGDGKSDMAGIGWRGEGLFGEGFSGIVFLWGREDGDFDRLELPMDYGDTRVGHILYAADVNGDNVPDLVWSKPDPYTPPGTLYVMLGQGNRTFGSPIEHSSAGRPLRFADADYNNDGMLDLAILYDESIGILYGNGDGTFQPVTSIGPYSSGQVSGANDLKAWDFDRDGRPDLAIDGQDGLMLFLNNGDGTFQFYALTAGFSADHPYDQPLHYGIADFNDDGRTDFVTTWTDYKVGVYLAIPAPSVTLTLSGTTSTLGETVTFTATVSPSDLLGPVTFYDGANVIGSEMLAAGQAVLTMNLLNPGTHELRAAYRGTLLGYSATFSPAVSHTVNVLPASNLFALPEMDTYFTLARLATGDFNRDGKVDLVASDGSYENKFHVFFGNGNGTFLPKVTFGEGVNRFVERPVLVGDWNGDGNTDVGIAGEGETNEYMSNGNGTFSWKRVLQGWAFLADVNRDGALDRIVDWGDVKVWLGMGDRHGNTLSFTSFSVGVTNHIGEIVSHDFNGDENLDIAVTTEWEDQLRIMLGRGDGSFDDPVAQPTGTRPISPVTADFNGDGKPDLAFSQAGAGTVKILLGEGDGDFTSAADVVIGGTLARIVAADLDGNGTADLAVLSKTQDRVLVFPGDGDGTFGTARMYYAGTSLVDLVAADFNVDGRMDLAVASSAGFLQGKIFIFSGVNPGPSSVTLNISAPSSNLSQEITMSATVEPSGAAGYVTFYDGATALGSAQVTSGQATFQTQFLDSGTHQLRAVFSGDGMAYGSSASAFRTHEVTASSVYAFGPPAALSPGVADYAAKADFNADGKVDFVVCNNSTAYLTVLLGQGNGQVLAGTPFQPCGGAPLAGDFNRDGKIDLIAGGSMLPGKGDGTFENPQSIAGLAGSTTMLAADFNGDGAPDVADIGYSLILLNRGNGSFESPIQMNLGFTTNFGAVGDLNGDGRADLAVPNSGGYVYILIGKGNGTFQPPVSYPTVADPSRVQIVDLNGDGIPDLAAANGERVAIMLGLGPGTFENWGDAFINVNQLQHLSSCDCNGDGNTDLLADGWTSTAKLLRGVGDGTFLDVVDYASIPDSRLLFLTDLNLDGKPDLILNQVSGTAGQLIVKMAIYPSSVVLAANPAPGRLSEQVTLTATLSPSDASGTIAFYDDAVLLGNATITGGQASLATSGLSAGGHKLRARYSGDPLNYVDGISSNVNLTVNAARGGRFSTGATFGTSLGPRGIAAGDLNGDGSADLVAANGTANTISVLLGNGTGGFAPRVSYNTSTTPVAVAIADLNGDGEQDVAVANSGSNNINVFTGNGDGTLQAAVIYALAGSPKSLFAADLNDDQRMDLVVAATNAVTVLLGTESGFSVSYIYSGSFNGAAAADLNGDGIIDIPALGTNSVLALVQGTGFSFTSASSIVVGTTPSALAMADFNGDGNPDLATANTGSDNVSVTLGNGNGTFQTAAPYAAGTAPAAIATADYDGDGKLDLVVVNGGSNSLRLLKGKGDGTFLAGNTLATGSSPKGVIPADFDGNGITDLAVTNSANNTASVFLGARPIAGVDFDGDGKSDIGIWRPDSGTWYGLSSNTPGDYFGIPWGLPTDYPVPGDYDGDGKTDLAVLRPNQGLWFVWLSGTPGTYTSTHWGLFDDIPVPGDYDGDGKADPAVFRQADGSWYALQSGSPGTYTNLRWGMAGDIAVPGDYDGDGKTDMAVWRSDTGTWYVLPSDSPGTYTSIHWGLSTDTPVPADYDGDGKTDIAAWRAETGTWYILESGSAGSYTSTQWGLLMDVPTAGDYDGDGKSDIAVWRPGDRVWYILLSGAPGSYMAIQWGVETDIAISPLTGILHLIP